MGATNSCPASIVDHELDRVFQLMGLATFLLVSIQELSLFSAVGFFLISISELLIDFVALHARVFSRDPRVTGSGAATSDVARFPGTFAVFVPAWRESNVIGQMLDAALESYANEDIHLFVGVYPNDPATRKIVRARVGPRISMVVVDRRGGTTKAHCLNNIYRAMVSQEAMGERRYSGVILHDAEDVINRREIDVFRRNAARYAMVQLPVYPLQHPESRWISGHYCDEFADAHSRAMIARQALGAALPSAGVGCMFRRDLIDAFAQRGCGMPFSEGSLTEDYEIGLRLRDLGFTSAFIVEADDSKTGVVCTRAYFPHKLFPAIRQKARWMAGIGLEGWVRLGWGNSWPEVWMRARDRSGLISTLLFLAAYLSLIAAILLWYLQRQSGATFSLPSGALSSLLHITLAMAIWRLLVRSLMTWRRYDPLESAYAVPRLIVGNLISICAACLAIHIHLAVQITGRVLWQKTEHIFPEFAS